MKDCLLPLLKPTSFLLDTPRPGSVRSPGIGGRGLLMDVAVRVPVNIMMEELAFFSLACSTMPGKVLFQNVRLLWVKTRRRSRRLVCACAVLGSNIAGSSAPPRLPQRP